MRLYGLVILIIGGVRALAAQGAPDYVPGRLLAGVRRSADPAVVVRALAAHRAAVARRISSAGADVLEVSEESSAAVMKSLRGTGLFEYVERDYYAHTAAVPNDPSYSLQWHLPAIRLPQAWDLTTGSSSAVVAVVDSGVDAAHPDLAAKLMPGWNFLSGNADTADVLGHGTAVAGAVAAASNNGIGGAGVSWASAIMPLVVVDADDYAAYSNIAAAIRYAADRGVRVINVSIGGTNPSAALQDAVDYAWSKGAVVFAAAMNAGGSTPYYPAACNHAVAVSATDRSDALASFSNYGPWIALSAPGAGILAPVMGGGYGYWYGTSFSSPIAAGVAALALAVNPGLSNTGLLQLLEQNADDLGGAGFDPSFGWGRVNAYKTVLAARNGASNVPAPAPVPAPPPVSTSAFTPIRVNAGGLAYIDAQGQNWSADTGFSGGSEWSTGHGIAGTGDAPLYQSQRWGAFGYGFTVPNGSYLVTLKFSEISQLGVGQRVFNVAVNGAAALANFDIYAQAGGGFLTLDKTFPVTVSNGQIQIAFTPGSANWPEVNGIEIAAAGPAFSPIRINAGGDSYTDPSGKLWSADEGFSGGSSWGTSRTLANTTAQPLYQTQRWGAFVYRFEVPNGSYLVTLKFSETSQLGVGQRIFDVAINGAAVLTNFDIYAQAGGGFLAIDKTFPVTVSNGRIEMAFNAGAANWPEVNAIEILAAGPAPAGALRPALPGRGRAEPRR